MNVDSCTEKCEKELFVSAAESHNKIHTPYPRPDSKIKRKLRHILIKIRGVLKKDAST